MTDLGDRVSDEPVGEQVRRRRVPRARLLAAVVALPVVAALAIAVAVLVPGNGGDAPVPAALVRQGSVPRFYALAYQSEVDGGRKVVTYAAVHSSATGGTLARITLPTLRYQGGTYGPSITAAADDRTFVVMESNQTSVHDIVWLFELQVSASGRAIRVSRLPVRTPPSVAIDDVALSPDGARLEMTAQWGCGHRGCQYAGIRVATLATGTVTTWSTRGDGAPFNGSWFGHNAVAFEWQPASGRAARYRLLPLSGTPADLLAASSPIASPPAEPNGYVPVALLTPDGRTVVTSEVRPSSSGITARIVELNARTGRVERTLYAAAAPSAAGQSGTVYQDCNVLALGPSGRHPLVDCFDKLGAVVNGQIASLPGFPSPSSSGIADQQAIAW